MKKGDAVVPSTGTALGVHFEFLEDGDVGHVTEVGEHGGQIFVLWESGHNLWHDVSELEVLC